MKVVITFSLLLWTLSATGQPYGAKAPWLSVDLRQNFEGTEIVERRHQNILIANGGIGLGPEPVLKVGLRNDVEASLTEAREVEYDVKVTLDQEEFNQFWNDVIQLGLEEIEPGSKSGNSRFHLRIAYQLKDGRRKTIQLYDAKLADPARSVTERIQALVDHDVRETARNSLKLTLIVDHIKRVSLELREPLKSPRAIIGARIEEVQILPNEDLRMAVRVGEEQLVFEAQLLHSQVDVNQLAGKWIYYIDSPNSVLESEGDLTQPVAVEMKDLLKEPQQYDGKRVRVRGLVTDYTLTPFEGPEQIPNGPYIGLGIGNLSPLNIYAQLRPGACEIDGIYFAGMDEIYGGVITRITRIKAIDP